MVEVETDAATYPLAKEVRSNILIYEAAALSLGEGRARRAAEEEWQRALTAGPGVIVVKSAFDVNVVDRVTAAFKAQIQEEKPNAWCHVEHPNLGQGDHFGKPGENSRVWNALEKLAVREPEAFVDYYSNHVLAAASHCWLGPGYQVTSQVNAVNPGGAAQEPHRDYHLGFMPGSSAARYPAHAHDLCPMLTLQGSVAHVDMPVESGATMFLPFSQRFRHGYLCWRREEFKRYFAARQVQLPLAKGDAVFFNPALLHGAGANSTSDVCRIGNLLQVSSAFGRAMETVDRSRVSLAVYPALIAASRREAWTPQLTANVVAAAAEGYSFPTNLDLDQPIGGLAPKTQADILTEAVTNGWSKGDFAKRLHECDSRHRTY